MDKEMQWGERLHAILKGALQVWRIDGRIARDRTKPALCFVYAAGVEVAVERVTDDGDAPYWEVSSLNPDDEFPPLPYAGIQGMLRAVRALLAPELSASRLVIGPRSGAD